MCDKGELELQVLSLKLSVFNASLFSVTHPENACLSSHRTESQGLWPQPHPTRVTAGRLRRFMLCEANKGQAKYATDWAGTCGLWLWPVPYQYRA